MNEFKGTPGPWALRLDENGYEVWAENQVPIAALYAFKNGGMGTEADPQKNGLLIAAAPQLLEVLAYAVEALDEVRWRSILGTEWMGEAKAAIAAALGQEVKS